MERGGDCSFYQLESLVQQYKEKTGGLHLNIKCNPTPPINFVIWSKNGNCLNTLIIILCEAFHYIKTRLLCLSNRSHLHPPHIFLNRMGGQLIPYWNGLEKEISKIYHIWAFIMRQFSKRMRTKMDNSILVFYIVFLNDI